ncbi:BON domain-containing protein [Vibrio hangzhouensis]|uniref:BON domain-containing protein n=1 Tax=Vibrio hangzhouensis TaxID=462991 RepID=UPI001C93EB0A|nr:BON domain-containing protein [Vibrio hangzhouensis]MBY6198627.1 BON domain-containing protein [Vibrio hangzhouensis]
MKNYKVMALLLASALLSGCAGLFVAGAATTVNLVTDTRTTKEIWNDNTLESEVAGMSNKSPYVGEVRVVASSQRGTVVLMGQAKTQALSNQLEAQVKGLNGVKRVYNQVRIKNPISFTQISNDSWLTTKVKSTLLTDERLNGVKVKVITEDKEVFLLGYVSKEHADIATDIARNVSGVQQVIRAFQFSEQQDKLNTEAEISPTKTPAPAPAKEVNQEEEMRPIIEEPAPFLEIEG